MGDIDQISRALGEMQATMASIQKMLEINQSEFRGRFEGVDGRVSLVEHRVNELEQAEYKRKGAIGILVSLAAFFGFIASLFSAALGKIVHFFATP